MHYNYLHTTMTMKRISTIGKHPREGEGHGDVRLGTLMTEDQETSLESCARAMYLEAAKHSVEPALTVTEQDTYLYQSGWYRRVIGPFFGSDDPAFSFPVDRMSSLFSEKKRRERKWQTRKW